MQVQSEIKTSLLVQFQQRPESFAPQSAFEIAPTDELIQESHLSDDEAFGPLFHSRITHTCEDQTGELQF